MSTSESLTSTSESLTSTSESLINGRTIQYNGVAKKTKQQTKKNKKKQKTNDTSWDKSQNKKFRFSPCSPPLRTLGPQGGDGLWQPVQQPSGPL